MVNSYLRSGRERPDPEILKPNAPLFYLGVTLHGAGFLVDEAERTQLLSLDSRNGECIFPYIGGEELNRNVDQKFERYVISFGAGATLEYASRWPKALQVVNERVRPERNKLNEASSAGKYRKEHWWQFAGHADDLYKSVSAYSRFLVSAQTSKHLIFAFVPSNWIVSCKLCAYSLDRDSQFAVLQSRVHRAWVLLLTSTMKSDISYTSSCFETFPFPKEDPLQVIADLETIGGELYRYRQQIMRVASQGLTRTYNMLQDPNCESIDAIELRRLHLAMDRAVLDAYGWTDIEVPPYCPKNDAERAAVKAFEDEVIDRLFVLNVERAAQERSASNGQTKPAAATKPKKVTQSDAKAPSKPTKKNSAKASEGQGSLF